MQQLHPVWLYQEYALMLLDTTHPGIRSMYCGVRASWMVDVTHAAELFVFFSKCFLKNIQTQRKEPKM